MDDSAAGGTLRFGSPAERGSIAPLRVAEAARPIVMVLGMHRSGTSLCSHVLSMLGVDMTDQIAAPGAASAYVADPTNPHGHWERWEIVEFHDRILRLFGREYYGPLHDFPLPVAWWADPRVAQIKREMAAFLEGRMSGAAFGFKDPRTTRLLPIWNQIFAEQKLTPKILLCLRSPGQVARSLQARDALDLEVGEYRWLAYMVDFYRYINASDFCTVEYETWFDRPKSNLEKIARFLDLEWQQSRSELDLTLSSIVDPASRHDEVDYREASLPLVRSLYGLAIRSDRDVDARKQIDDIAAQFVEFHQLHRPLIQPLDELPRLTAELAKTKATEAELRAALAERDAALEAASVRAAEATEQAAGLQAQLASREAHAAETGSLRGELAARDERLRGLDGEAADHQRFRQLAEMRAAESAEQIRQLHAELADRRVELAARADRLLGLEGELVRLSGEAEARDGQLAGLERELAQLRTELGIVATQRGLLLRQQSALAARFRHDLTVRDRDLVAAYEGQARTRQSEIDTLRLHAVAQEERLRTVRREIDNLHSGAAAQEDRARVLQFEIDGLKSGLAVREEHAQNLQGELDTLRTSASWRLTAPLRRLKARFPGTVRRAGRVLRPGWRAARFVYRRLPGRGSGG
jgi:hypothetical protein